MTSRAVGWEALVHSIKLGLGFYRTFHQGSIIVHIFLEVPGYRICPTVFISETMEKCLAHLYFILLVTVSAAECLAEDVSEVPDT